MSKKKKKSPKLKDFTVILDKERQQKVINFLSLDQLFDQLIVAARVTSASPMIKSECLHIQLQRARGNLLNSTGQRFVCCCRVQLHSR